MRENEKNEARRSETMRTRSVTTNGVKFTTTLDNEESNYIANINNGVTLSVREKITGWGGCAGLTPSRVWIGMRTEADGTENTTITGATLKTVAHKLTGNGEVNINKRVNIRRDFRNE